MTCQLLGSLVTCFVRHSQDASITIGSIRALVTIIACRPAGRAPRSRAQLGPNFERSVRLGMESTGCELIISLINEGRHIRSDNRPESCITACYHGQHSEHCVHEPGPICRVRMVRLVSTAL
jgi:hypothetical protein